MGKLLQMNPELHFPWGRPFQVHDEYNGHQRGTWYFRSRSTGVLNGPFRNFDEAEHVMDREEYA